MGCPWVSSHNLSPKTPRERDACFLPCGLRSGVASQHWPSSAHGPASSFDLAASRPDSSKVERCNDAACDSTDLFAARRDEPRAPPMVPSLPANQSLTCSNSIARMGSTIAERPPDARATAELAIAEEVGRAIAPLCTFVRPTTACFSAQLISSPDHSRTFAFHPILPRFSPTARSTTPRSAWRPSESRLSLCLRAQCRSSAFRRRTRITRCSCLMSRGATMLPVQSALTTVSLNG